MFPGRRLTRWCQLVPRVLIIKNGRVMIATAKHHEQQQQHQPQSPPGDSSGTMTEIVTTHSMDLVPTLEAKDTLIILVDADASSAGDLGVIVMKVPLKAAGEERMILDVKAKKIHEEIRAGTRVLAMKKEANERSKEMKDAVTNSLMFTVHNRTILERGTDCSCLVFELSGTDRNSGIFGRDKLLKLIRDQVYEQVSKNLDETAIRMSNEMKAKNFVSDAVTFTQHKKEELFERMFHVLYSETSIVNFIADSSSFTEILKSKLLPSSIISPILGTILAAKKKISNQIKTNNNDHISNGDSHHSPTDQHDEAKRKQMELMPRMTVPRQLLMKQLSDSVDHVKEEMKKRRQEKLLELQKLKEEQEQQKRIALAADSSYSSSLSPLAMKTEREQIVKAKQLAKELYDFSSSDDDADGDHNNLLTKKGNIVEMVVNGKTRTLGAYGGFRKEKLMKKYAIDKLKRNLLQSSASSSSSASAFQLDPTTSNNNKNVIGASPFSTLESRERMLMVMRSVELKKMERKKEQAQLQRDLQLLARVDALLERTEVYDPFLVNDDDMFSDDDECEEHQFQDLINDSASSTPKKSARRLQVKQASSTATSPTKQQRDDHRLVVTKPPLTEEEQRCRTQQQMLNLLIIKICSQQVSRQHAREIGEAERKLL